MCDVGDVNFDKSFLSNFKLIYFLDFQKFVKIYVTNVTKLKSCHHIKQLSVTLKVDLRHVYVTLRHKPRWEPIL